MTNIVRDEPVAPKIVDRAAFQADLDALRVREKAHTNEGGAILVVVVEIREVVIFRAGKEIGGRLPEFTVEYICRPPKTVPPTSCLNGYLENLLVT
jgi:hypothetical protein